jgi:hypothetical protein
MSEVVLLTIIAFAGWCFELFTSSILRSKIAKLLEEKEILKKLNSRLAETNAYQKSQIDLNNKEIAELLNIHQLSDFSSNIKKSRISMN